MLLTEEIFGTYEVAIVGDGAENLRKEMEKNYVPNKIMLGGTKGSLPLLRDKFSAGTQIFICKDKTCGLPVVNVTDALKQIKEWPTDTSWVPLLFNYTQKHIYHED